MRSTLLLLRLKNLWLRPLILGSFLSVLFNLSLAATARGADDGKDPLRASARVIFDKPESTNAELVIELNLDEPYKAYADRFKLQIESPEGTKVGDIHLTPLIQFLDTFSKKMKDGVKKHATLTAAVQFPAVDPKGIRLKLTYQACTADHCLFPKHLSIDPTLVHGKESSREMIGGKQGQRAEAGGDTASNADDSVSNSSRVVSAGRSSDFERALQNGLLSAVLFMFIAGFLTSLTPCIYPMIPITLAILGATDRRGHQTHGRSKTKSFLISVFYVLGIATTYSALGVTAASTGAMFGAALSNIWVVSVLGLIFILMGLSMYGLFEIQAPAFIRDRLGQGKTETGFASSYATGLAAGVVASPCIGPVLVSVLTYIAQTQNRILGFVLLFSFALGMGMLFILLGTSSSLINRVPKAGPWMDVVKFIFGTTMVAMAIYYVAPVYPTWLVRGLAGLALILISSAYGVFSTGTTGIAHVRKGAFIASFCVGIALIMASTLEKSGVTLGSYQQASNGATKPIATLPWQPFSESALAQALQDGKPVLVDFWADWCGACHELEEKTFPDPRIQALGSKFVLLKVDATEDSDELTRLRKKFNVLGLPTMIFYDPSGRLRSDLTVTGFENADQFLKKMEKASAPN